MSSSGFYIGSPFGMDMSSDTATMLSPSFGTMPVQSLDSITSSVTAQAPTLASSFDWTSAAKSAGTGMAIFGAVQGAIGSFFSAKLAASNLKFQSEMSQINARMAESQAQSIMAAGQKQIGQVTMRAGKVKSAQKASMAANGIDLGVGNAAETTATTDLMKEIDSLTINANAVRAAGAARTQSVNLSNQSLLQGVSANAISPFSAGAASLMTSGASVASSWFRDKQADRLAALLGQ